MSKKNGACSRRETDLLRDCSDDTRRFGGDGGAIELRGGLPIEQGLGMHDERDVLVMWRKLFHGATINDRTVHTAKSLLKKLPPESPLRVRLASELDDICRLWKLERKDDE
jgi:hypothetical protein